jgi:hypothetical protein
MALAGVHLAFGYCNNGTVGLQQPPSLLFGCTSSQLMASAGTSTVAAPASSGIFQACASISASAPIFYAFGPAPVADGSDPVPKRRYMDPANGAVDLFVNAGDKLAWVFA